MQLEVDSSRGHLVQSSPKTIAQLVFPHFKNTSALAVLAWLGFTVAAGSANMPATARNLLVLPNVVFTIEYLRRNGFGVGDIVRTIQNAGK